MMNEIVVFYEILIIHLKQRMHIKVNSWTI